MWEEGLRQQTLGGGIGHFWNNTSLINTVFKVPYCMVAISKLYFERSKEYNMKMITKTSL